MSNGCNIRNKVKVMIQSITEALLLIDMAAISKSVRGMAIPFFLSLKEIKPAKRIFTVTYIHE
jgi:hypothetical protein